MKKEDIALGNIGVRVTHRPSYLLSKDNLRNIPGCR